MGQENPVNNQTDTLQLPEMIVLENRLELPLERLARNLQIITRKELNKLPVLYFTDALQYVPGIDVRQRGPFGVQTDISIRGGTFDQTLILLNGVKMSDPQTGHHAAYLPANLMQIQQIEVLKGSSARIYGQNAFSGAINVHTFIPEDRRIYVHAFGGDFGLLGTQLGISLPWKNYRQFFCIGYNRSQGYRYNTDFNILQGFYQSELTIGQRPLSIMAGLSDRRFGANGFYASPQFKDQYEAVRTGFAALRYRYTSGSVTIKPTLSWRNNLDNYVFIRSNPSFFNNLHQTDIISAEIHSKVVLPRGDLLGFGLETRREVIVSSNLGNHSRQISGLFAEYNVKGDGWHITPGFYANYFSDYGLQWFPGIDAHIKVNTNISVFATTGRSFRLPTYTDLYYKGPSNIGNPHLRPEAAWTQEAGVKFDFINFHGQLSAYFLRGLHLIDWTRTQPSDPWQPTNLNDLKSMGFECQLGYQPRENKWLSQWLDKCQLSYHYIHSDLDEMPGIESRYALEHLRHQFLFSVDHTLWGKLHHTMRLRWIDRISMPAYFVWDSQINWQLDDTSIYLEISNLTNTMYRETNLVEMPGRWFRLGAKTSIGF